MRNTVARVENVYFEGGGENKQKRSESKMREKPDGVRAAEEYEYRRREVQMSKKIRRTSGKRCPT